MKQCREIHASILTNPWNNFDKSMKQFWQIQQFEQNLKRGVSDFRWHYFLLLNWLYIVWCICQMHQSQVSELASSSAWKELSLAFADERLSNACTEAFENYVPLLSGFWNGVCLQHSFKKAACLVHHSLCLLLKCQNSKRMSQFHCASWISSGQPSYVKCLKKWINNSQKRLHLITNRYYSN